MTKDEIKQIRVIIREEVRPVVRDEVGSILDTKLAPLSGKLEALENGRKEIYSMISDNVSTSNIRNTADSSIEKKDSTYA